MKFLNPVLEPAPKLPRAPTTLKADETAFLEKFQPLVGTFTVGDNIANGWCYAEYPCHPLSNPATAELPGANGVALPAITPTEATDLLNLLLDMKTVDLKPSSLYPGFTTSSVMTDNTDLTLYALTNSIDSAIIAGAVFDLYKITADSVTKNTIRAVQVQTKFTLCLRPKGAELTTAENFCLGKELNGALPPKATWLTATMANR